MISYCIPCYRPRYARLLIDDLVRKTTVPCEILLWLNVADPEFEEFLDRRVAEGAPIRVVGRTPENIGMAALFDLFAASRFELVAQIDDDVVCVSPRIAEIAREVFSRFERVGMLTADVWQDEYTGGARPPMSQYRRVDLKYGLYEGPIDGWFAVYRKSCLDVCRDLERGRYTCVGAGIHWKLGHIGMQGLLCTRMKVFHVIGAAYASYFGMLHFEIEKYRSLERMNLVEKYSSAKVPPLADLHGRFLAIQGALSRAPRFRLMSRSWK